MPSKSLTTLPSDIVALLIRHMSPRDLVALSATSRALRSASLEQADCLLQEMWEIGRSASWRVRAPAAASMQVLSRLTGRRPKVPYLFFCAVYEAMVECKTDVEISVTAVEIIYFVLGDIDILAANGRREIAFNRFIGRVGQAAEPQAPPWGVTYRCADQDTRELLDEIAQNIVKIVEHARRTHIKANDVHQGLAILLRLHAPLHDQRSLTRRLESWADAEYSDSDAGDLDWEEPSDMPAVGSSDLAEPPEEYLENFGSVTIAGTDYESVFDFFEEDDNFTDAEIGYDAWESFAEGNSALNRVYTDRKENEFVCENNLICCHGECGCILAGKTGLGTRFERDHWDDWVGIYGQAQKQVEDAFYGGDPDAHGPPQYATIDELNNAITDRAHELVCAIRRPCVCAWVTESHQCRRRFERWRREGQRSRLAAHLLLERLGMRASLYV